MNSHGVQQIAVLHRVNKDANYIRALIGTGVESSGNQGGRHDGENTVRMRNGRRRRCPLLILMVL